MLDTKDTLILFGRSPFINKIRDKVPEIIKKYTTMGCNYFCESFPEVDYVIFYDDICPKVKNSTIVTQYEYFKYKKHKCAQLIPDYPKKELYMVVKNDYIFTSVPNALYFHFHTPSMALNWAWQKGFKNVVLAGIDLVNHTPHFDCKTAPDPDYPKWFDSDLVKAKKHIKEVAGRYLNIFQLNPDSDMEVEKITIEELLNNDLIKTKGENMEKVKIKLKSAVILAGKVASPDDEKNGIYEVTKTVANELIARNRAELATDIKEKNTPPAAGNDVVYDIEKLKEIAGKLDIKFNPNIGGEKLNKKIVDFLAEKDEKLAEQEDAIKAFDLFESNQKDEQEQGETYEELVKIATEANIDFQENIGYEDLKEQVALNLEQYASELNLELGENWEIKDAWEKIKEKIQND